MTKAEKPTFNPAALEAMHASAPLNYGKALEIANAYDLKVRSVIAKAVREKIPYNKIVRVRKDGKPIASKESIVAVIEDAVSLPVGALEGLVKASKESLERLRDALAEPEADEE